MLTCRQACAQFSTVHLHLYLHRHAAHSHSFLTTTPSPPAPQALHNHRTVVELPKLEAAILNARKVGAGDIDEQLYRSASDLRAKLTDASKARQGLDAALRTLQRQQRSEDAEAVERWVVLGCRRVHVWAVGGRGLASPDAALIHHGSIYY